MTYYLKYRPKNIEDLDLSEIKDQIFRIVKSENMPHAYLFAGPRGAGKTSAARILAKAVNCEKLHKNGEPCNDCSQCEQVNKGSSLDIIEMDAASNRGVDDIRSLRDTISLSPSFGRKKVYIMDEAHMLTTEASNALLKTLEEPPSHALFILATTAPEKLLDTIKSRCLILNFRKANVEEVVKSLAKVVLGEKLDVENGVLEEIAKRSDGSFREAHKILEQIALGKMKVSIKDLESAKFSSINVVKEFINYLAVKDTKNALSILVNAEGSGANIKILSNEIVSNLRDLILANFGVVKNESKLNISLGDLQILAQYFSEASAKIPTSTIPSLPLELAVVRWGEGSKDDSHSIRIPSNLISPVDEDASENLSNSQTATPGLSNSVLNELGTSLKSPSSSVNNKVAANSEAKEDEPENDKEKELGKVETLPRLESVDSKILEEKWKEMLSSLKPNNFSIETLLRSARPASFDGKNLYVEVFYGFHKERLEKEQYRKIVEEMACEIFKTKNIRLVCLLSSAPRRSLNISNVTDAEDNNILEVAEKIFGGGDSVSGSDLPN